MRNSVTYNSLHAITTVSSNAICCSRANFFSHFATSTRGCEVGNWNVKCIELSRMRLVVWVVWAERDEVETGNSCWIQVISCLDWFHFTSLLLLQFFFASEKNYHFLHVSSITLLISPSYDFNMATMKMSVLGVQQKKTQRRKGTRGKVEGADLVFMERYPLCRVVQILRFLFLLHFYHLLVIRDF